MTIPDDEEPKERAYRCLECGSVFCLDAGKNVFCPGCGSRALRVLPVGQDEPTKDDILRAIADDLTPEERLEVTSVLVGLMTKEQLGEVLMEIAKTYAPKS